MFLVSLTVITLFAVTFGDTGAPSYLSNLRTPGKIGNPFVGGTWHYPGCATDTANGWSVWVFAVDKPHDSNGTSLSITAFSSPETDNWYMHEKVVDMSGFSGANASLYSPTPVFRKDKYYLYFSATGYPPDTPLNERTVGNYSGIWVGVADKPEGPYENPLPNNTALIPAEDPTITEPRGPAILVDKDRTYLFYGPGGESLAFVELDDDMITLKNESKTLTMPPGNYGGLKVFKRSEMYYIVWNDVQLARPGVPERPSSIRYAMSADLDGSFYGGDAVLAGDPFVARSVYHADILEVMDDVWYIFYARSQSNPDVSDAVVEGLAWEQVKFVQSDKSIIPVTMGLQSQWSSDYNWTNPYKLPVGVLPHDANAKFSAGKIIRQKGRVDRFLELDATGTQSAVHGMMLVGFEDFQLDIGIYFEERPDIVYIDGSAGIIFGGRKDDKNVEGWTGHTFQVTPQGYFSLNRMDQNGGNVKKLEGYIAVGDTALITIKTEGNRTRVFIGDISPEDKIMEYEDSVYQPGWIGFRAYGLKARYGGFTLQKVREPDFAVASSQITDKETEESGKPSPTPGE